MSTSARQQLAEAMKRERSSLQISQETLAERAGLHRTYISQVERGTRNVGIDNIEKIAAALSTSLSGLFAVGSSR